MASAEIAAPPMASAIFQCASKPFNKQTPSLKCVGPRMSRGRLHARTGAKGLLHPPMPHLWVFYRNLEVYVKLRLRCVHRIAQHANTRNADLDRVAGNKRTDASGRAGGDDVAGHQHHHAGNPANKKRRRIGHQRGDAGLAAYALDVSLRPDIPWIQTGFRGRADSAESIKTLAASD